MAPPSGWGSPNKDESDLFELGRRYFALFSAELAAYGVPVDPAMELRHGKGMLCYYDLKDGHIYLSVPDLRSPMGQLQATLLASMLGCEDLDELHRFFGIFIPRLIAHELAHHLRHRHGVFGGDMWHEEQIANRLAGALAGRRLAPSERAFAGALLRRALEGLSTKVETRDAATISYHDVLRALNAAGRIDDSTLERMQVVQTLFSMKPEEMLDEGAVSIRFGEQLRQRDSIIHEINAEYYAPDYAKYMYYHAGWLHLDLSGHGAEYVDDFARTYLGVSVPVLLPARLGMEPTEQEILASYQAYRQTSARSPAGARYFYKRYRRLLWTKLQAADPVLSSQAEIMRREASFFLESWTEGESDALGYLVQIAPQELRPLFPNRLEQGPLPDIDTGAHLPTETDTRLYRHIVLGEPDEAAENTLLRLTLLDRTDVFRSMPAESMLELARSFCRVFLPAGETVIWEGEVNDDVFFLTTGALDVLVGSGGEERRVGAVHPGEVFGEMAFFSRDVRNATVRAVVPSECFVIKDTDLLRLSFKHPSILMQMAGALTRRLAGSNRRAAQRA